MELLCALCYLGLIYIGIRLISKLLMLPQISDLDLRYIFVTGCDTGFGNAIAKKLDGLGCHVIAACLTEGGETELRKSCSNKLRTVHMDVSSKESVKRAYGEVVKMLPQGKGLWGLINNAGIAGRTGPIDWLNLDDYHKVLGVNLLGLIETTLTFLPLIKRERGRIVNTASMAGRIATTTAPYTVSKYGVEAFSDMLRRDMASFKVKVSIIEPTFYTTGMTQTSKLSQAMREAYDTLPQHIKNDYGEDYLKSSLNALDKTLDRGRLDDITPVLDAYTHGLLAKYPKARYTMGGQVTIGLVIQALPEWLGDRLLNMFMTKPTPAACKNL